MTSQDRLTKAICEKKDVRSPQKEVLQKKKSWLNPFHNEPVGAAVLQMENITSKVPLFYTPFVAAIPLRPWSTI